MSSSSENEAPSDQYIIVDQGKPLIPDDILVDLDQPNYSDDCVGSCEDIDSDVGSEENSDDNEEKKSFEEPTLYFNSMKKDFDPAILLIQQKLIYDSVNGHFVLSNFFKQLVAHLFLPAVPFFTNMRAQHFIPRDFAGFLFNIFVTVMLYISIVSYILLSDHDKMYLEGAVVMPVVLFVQHRLTVAMKYASLSNTEYEKFINCTDMKLADDYTNQMQLLADWSQRKAYLVEFEMAAAAIRIAAKINKIYFSIVNPDLNKSASNGMKQWQMFLSDAQKANADKHDWDKRFIKQPDQNYKISVFDVAVACVKNSNKSGKEYQQYLFGVILLYTIINTSIPLISSLRFHQKWESKLLVVLFLTSSSFVNILFGFTVNFVLSVAIWDSVRTLYVTKLLHSMIRTTDFSLEHNFAVSHQKATEQDHILAYRNIKLMLSLINHNSFEQIQDDLHEKIECQIPEMDRRFRATTYQNNTLSDINEESFYHKSTPQEPSIQPNILQRAISRRFSTIQRNLLTTNQDVNTPPLNKSRKSQRSEALGECVITDWMVKEPRLHLTFPQNINSWVFCRLAVQNFGERFRLRTDSYTAGMLLMLIVMMCGVLIILFTTENLKAAFNSCFIRQACLAIVMIYFLTITIATIGTLVNTELASHSRTLSLHALRVRHDITQTMVRLQLETQRKGSSVAALEQELIDLSEISDNIQSAIDITALNTELKPFKIMGFTAQSSFVISIITSFTSFFFLLAGLYTNMNNDESSSRNS